MRDTHFSGLISSIYICTAIATGSWVAISAGVFWAAWSVFCSLSWTRS